MNIEVKKHVVSGHIGSALSEEKLEVGKIYEIYMDIMRARDHMICLGVSREENSFLGVDFC